jgi:hypothetical protein
MIKIKQKTRVRQFIDTYAKWLIVEDTDYFFVVFGAIFANRFLNSKPLWLYVVAPPGGGKTELLQALDGHQIIFSLSSLTDKTLISGMIQADSNPESDPSLLPKLNGKILVIKDFTVILKERRDVLSSIMGQLRDMYDGKSRRSFGTGKATQYESKFGIIAGVTPEVDCHLTALSSLGERFVLYRLPELTNEEMTARAMQASKNINADKQEAAIQKAAHYVLDMEPSIPVLPDERLKQIEEMAALVAKARTHVSRDRYSREVLCKPTSEIHTRLLKQLSDLARGIAMAREKKVVGDDEIRLICKVGMDCIPSNRLRLLEFLAQKFSKSVNNQEAADACKLSRSAMFYWMDDLFQLELVEKIESTSNLNRSWSRYSWRLRGKYAKLLKKRDNSDV